MNGSEKLAYIRTIAMWAAVMALVVFAYQLGQYNTNAVITQIQTFCPPSVNFSSSSWGSTALWHNTQAFMTP